MYPLYHAALPAVLEEVGATELKAAHWVLYGLHIGLVSHGYLPANENNFLAVQKGTLFQLVPSNLLDVFRNDATAVNLHYSRLNDHLAIKVEISGIETMVLEPILNGSVREKTEIKPSEYIRNAKDGAFVDGKLDELVRTQMQQAPPNRAYMMPMIVPVHPPVAPSFTPPPDFNGMLMGPGHPNFRPRFDPIFPDNPFGRSPQDSRGPNDARPDLPEFRQPPGSNDARPNLPRSGGPNSRFSNFY